MVEHSRAHTRLKEENPPGRREKLDLGTLFIPAALKGRRDIPLLLFFHGGTWLPDVAGARDKVAVIAVQAGVGSSTYVRLFEDPKRFLALLEDAQSTAKVRFNRVYLGGWSAGCGAVRQILRTPESYARVTGVLVIDGMHTDYAGGRSASPEPNLNDENLNMWVHLGKDAVAGKKRALVTHTEIFPGSYASTTETSDWLVEELKLKLKPVLKWAPVGTQQISEAKAGRFRIMGFAGNSAPDHIDQLHSLPVFLKAIL